MRLFSPPVLPVEPVLPVVLPVLVVDVLVLPPVLGDAVSSSPPHAARNAAAKPVAPVAAMARLRETRRSPNFDQ